MKRANPEELIHEIAAKKQGRPSLLPEDVMEKTISIVKSLRLKGAPVTYSVIAAVAKGAVIASDRCLLVENGGHLQFSDYWARKISYKLCQEEKRMVRRLGNTASLPIAPALIEETRLDFQRKIKLLQEQCNIPDELILNFDQTPLAYICAPNHTLEVQGAKSVPIVGEGKKQQITGTFTVTKSGSFLAMQLIYTGKTLRCLPKGITFPDGFDVTFTSNHWSNEEKAIQHIEKIVLPYLKQTREELNLPPDQKELLIFDVFKGQTTQTYQEYIHNNHMVFVNVPANMTRYFQPLDLTINGQSKQFLKKKFEEWYSKQVTSQLAQGANVYDIEVKLVLSVLKPIHARWLISLYDHLRNNCSDSIKKGFRIAGIDDILLEELEAEDPFADL